LSDSLGYKQQRGERRLLAGRIRDWCLSIEAATLWRTAKVAFVPKDQCPKA
jgi:hypothetical protein